MKKDVKIKMQKRSFGEPSCNQKFRRAISYVFLAVILVFVFLPMTSDGVHFQSEMIFYYPARYDENIFENQLYLEFERDLRFSYGGVTQVFNFEKDYEDATKECKFFLDYFHTVILGDYEKLPSFHVEGYFTAKPMFTMQMLYEPGVSFHSQEKTVINGQDVTIYNFSVVYKIFKNNGTFRRGIHSNTAVPQIYQLIQSDDGSYRIFKILDVVNQVG